MQTAVRTWPTLLCALALALSACSSKPVQRTEPAEPAPLVVAPPPAAAPPAVAPQLAAEQRWLLDLFQGTPVLIGPGPGGELRVEVPLKYAFDSGPPVVKPPLGGVLDKLAASLKRLPRTRVQTAAPTLQQTNALREALVARGVAVQRIGQLPARADAVELRLLPAPVAIERLEDPPQITNGRH